MEHAKRVWEARVGIQRLCSLEIMKGRHTSLKDEGVEFDDQEQPVDWKPGQALRNGGHTPKNKGKNEKQDDNDES